MQQDYSFLLHLKMEPWQLEILFCDYGIIKLLLCSGEDSLWFQ